MLLTTAHVPGTMESQQGGLGTAGADFNITHPVMIQTNGIHGLDNNNQVRDSEYFPELFLELHRNANVDVSPGIITKRTRPYIYKWVDW